jgi:chorismate mutase
MPVRGIRGAITTECDSPEAILGSTRKLLQAILESNPHLTPKDIASAIFTATPDLQATYPAQAARQMGWSLVPMMCAQEIPVPGSLPRCIRVLLHWNTDIAQEEVRHVYLGAATSLRPDIIQSPEVSKC